jgi:hypothetical protein
MTTAAIMRAAAPANQPWMDELCRFARGLYAGCTHVQNGIQIEFPEPLVVLFGSDATIQQATVLRLWEGEHYVFRVYLETSNGVVNAPVNFFTVNAVQRYIELAVCVRKINIRDGNPSSLGLKAVATIGSSESDSDIDAYLQNLEGVQQTVR